MESFSAVADSRAPPHLAAGVILNPENLPRWFRGAIVTAVDPHWPEPGSTMSWRVGRMGAFRATSVDARLPDLAVADVVTPSGRSRVTHRFHATPGGGTRYEKTVETEQRGAMRFLVRLFLPAAMKGEVRRACALADEELTRAQATAAAPR